MSADAKNLAIIVEQIEKIALVLAGEDRWLRPKVEEARREKEADIKRGLADGSYDKEWAETLRSTDEI
jgi:hypothetical protein